MKNAECFMVDIGRVRERELTLDDARLLINLTKTVFIATGGRLSEIPLYIREQNSKRAIERI